MITWIEVQCPHCGEMHNEVDISQHVTLDCEAFKLILEALKQIGKVGEG